MQLRPPPYCIDRNNQPCRNILFHGVSLIRIERIHVLLYNRYYMNKDKKTTPTMLLSPDLIRRALRLPGIDTASAHSLMSPSPRPLTRPADKPGHPRIGAVLLVLREAARVLRPEGRGVIVDFEAHEEAWLLDEEGHRWAGFEPAQIAGWCVDAGLSVPAFERVPTPDGGRWSRIEVFVARFGRPAHAGRARRGGRR